MLLCHLSIWNCRLLAFRAKKLFYQTILTTPPLLFWACSQLLQWLSGSSPRRSCCVLLFCSLELSVCHLLCSLELVAARCRCVLVVHLWLRMWEVTLLPCADQAMALCSVVVMVMITAWVWSMWWAEDDYIHTPPCSVCNCPKHLKVSIENDLYMKITRQSHTYSVTIYNTHTSELAKSNFKFKILSNNDDDNFLIFYIENKPY